MRATIQQAILVIVQIWTSRVSYIICGMRERVGAGFKPAPTCYTAMLSRLKSVIGVVFGFQEVCFSQPGSAEAVIGVPM